MCDIEHFDSMRSLFLQYVPEFKCRNYKPFIASFNWDKSVVLQMNSISSRRVEKRLSSYLIPGELSRSERERVGPYVSAIEKLASEYTESVETSASSELPSRKADSRHFTGHLNLLADCTMTQLSLRSLRSNWEESG